MSAAPREAVVSAFNLGAMEHPEPLTPGQSGRPEGQVDSSVSLVISKHCPGGCEEIRLQEAGCVGKSLL